ncbi:hypothetical protein BJV82DRAFT_349039 [Fennellomyces sp. T-0311]|nr:hypothetical protein BJV82DRAFT_349039 [Fennellomyces sp. T-0311]
MIKKYYGGGGLLNVINRYTQQFRTVDKLVAVQSDQTGTSGGLESFPEYQQYYNYFNRTALDNSSNNNPGLQTHSIDEQVYRTYVDIPRRVAAVQMTRDWSGNARRRYEGYASYLKNGRYPQHHGSQRQLMAALQNNVMNATAAAAQALLSGGDVKRAGKSSIPTETTPT